jgi:hypothetical protein
VTADPGRRLLLHRALARPHPLIGRRAGQQLARRELARRMYRQPVITRFLRWLAHELSGVMSAASNFPGGMWTVVAVLVILVLVAAAVIYWLHPAAVRHTVPAELGGAIWLSAGEYRERAARSAADGNYSAAILDSLRAIAADLSERGIVADRPGRTADELAAEAGEALPALAAGLMRTARLFDEVRYGDRTGTEAGYLSVRKLDASIRATRAGAAAVAGRS